MDAVTYPHPDVAPAIDEGFVPYKINMMERHPDFKEACAGGRVLWGPTFIVADSRGSEIRRWVGWLPPEAFVAELAFCRALAHYNSGRFAEALAGFDGVVETGAGTEIHPEALYWQGIAGFMAGKFDWDALERSWRQVVEQYPGHRFATHAAVIDDRPV
jgi:TolA-binding protein